MTSDRPTIYEVNRAKILALTKMLVKKGILTEEDLFEMKKQEAIELDEFRRQVNGK